MHSMPPNAVLMAWSLLWLYLPAGASIHKDDAVYFSFFFGRSWFVCPHFFLRQLVARGGRRAYSLSRQLSYS